VLDAVEHDAAGVANRLGGGLPHRREHRTDVSILEFHSIENAIDSDLNLAPPPIG
jgi:hypothetical protein